MPRCVLLVIVLLLAARLNGTAGVFESIARIRALSTEEASRQLPAAIEATVTVYPSSEHGFHVHDGKEGIFIVTPDDAGRDATLHPGSRLRIEGVTDPGGFLPSIKAQRITKLGEAPLPEPQRIDGSELFSPSLDCQWVQVAAVITGVDRGPWPSTLVAEVSGWTVKIQLPDSPEAAEGAAKLMQRPVTIRGVVGSVFNDQRQMTGRYLIVSSLDQISEIALPNEPPPLRAINELLRGDTTSQSRLRVRGTVTYAANDGLYLRGEGGSLLVRAAKTALFTPGTLIEAEGFAAVAPFRPVLRATRITALEQMQAPQPHPLDLSGKNIVLQQAELVTTEAEFLTRRDGPNGEQALQCQAGRWFFEALIPAGTALPMNLGAHDRLRLTGICDLTTTRPLAFPEGVDGLRLHLRNADGITLLHRAPWWTLRRLLWALSAVGALAVASLTGVAMLRRRVIAQTEIIGSQIERAAVKDERQRIARELHDTIEQELAGLSIQLRNARRRLTDSPQQAGMAVELAERMLRHCREEARTSIRDLRSVTLEQCGLHGALNELLAPLVAECGARFVFHVDGPPRSLTGPVELQFLRIAHQAVSNAVHHAAPGEVCVRLVYAPAPVTLEIRDDGCGFDPGAPIPRGHFGILGIRERANKLHATFTLESAPGSGTTLRVVLPADPLVPVHTPAL